MAYLTWVVRILLFLVLLGFAARNLDIVHVHGYLNTEWQAPLVLVMLAALVVGVVIGVAGTLRTAVALSLRGRQPVEPLAPEPAPAGAPVVPLRSAPARPPREFPAGEEGA